MDLDLLRSAVGWRDGRLEIVDQTLLPERLVVRQLASVAEVVDALGRLAVRGAPAIGVAGAFGVVLGLAEAGPPRPGPEGLAAARADLRRAADTLAAARPTAVNLGWAVRRVAAAADRAADAAELRRLALEEAMAVLEEDRAACARMAEARPLLQGARLTAWELVSAGIPVTVVADTAAGAAMAGGLVDAVLVGCDRVAANGDTANKIGTYSLAVLARANAIPFYVVGPLSSFDPAAADGAAIQIEQRPAGEVAMVAGSRLAPEAAGIWNPAFDVTPAELITAFITDAGVLRPPFGPAIATALVSR